MTLALHFPPTRLGAFFPFLGPELLNAVATPPKAPPLDRHVSTQRSLCSTACLVVLTKPVHLKSNGKSINQPGHSNVQPVNLSTSISDYSKIDGNIADSQEQTISIGPLFFTRAVLLLRCPHLSIGPTCPAVVRAVIYRSVAYRLRSSPMPARLHLVPGAGTQSSPYGT